MCILHRDSVSDTIYMYAFERVEHHLVSLVNGSVAIVVQTIKVAHDQFSADR